MASLRIVDWAGVAAVLLASPALAQTTPPAEPSPSVEAVYEAAARIVGGVDGFRDLTVRLRRENDALTTKLKGCEAPK